MPDQEPALPNPVPWVHSSQNIKTPSELSWVGNLADNWKFFIQKFNIYLTATKSNKEPKEFQTALLLNMIGDRALKIYNNFSFESQASKENITVVIKKFPAKKQYRCI